MKTYAHQAYGMDEVPPNNISACWCTVSEVKKLLREILDKAAAGQRSNNKYDMRDALEDIAALAGDTLTILDVS